MIKDREDAGEILAEALSSQNQDFDMVLLTSLESFDIGKEVASALDIPLNSIISRHLKAPGGENVFGAVSERNTIWIDDEKMQEFSVKGEYISKIKQDRIKEIQRSLNDIGLNNIPDLHSKDVLLVSEGIDTGITEAASLGAALRAGTSSRVMISPFISEKGLERMGLADEIICLERSSYPVTSKELLSGENKINQDRIKDYFRA